MFGDKNLKNMQKILIGIKRTDLFSDVLGSWATELRNDTNKSVAQKVVTKFLSDIKQAEVNPLDVFINWPSWRQWIERQAGGDVAPDYSLLSGVMLHAIQPAFYNGEIPSLRKLVSSIIIDANLSSELPDAKRVTAAVCDYYAYTESGPPSKGHMNQVVKSLSNNHKINTQSCVTSWIEIIRLNFIGLAYRQMSIRSKGSSQKDTYAKQSLDSFLESGKHLSSLNATNDPIVSLWKGYNHRNLGRVYQSLGDLNNSKSELVSSLEERERSMSLIRSNNINNAIDMQLMLEIQSVEMDLSDIGHCPNPIALDETVEALQMFREKTGVFGIWKRAILQAESSCKKLGRPDLVKVLKKLK